MDCVNCPLRPKCEMRKEVISDLKVVYYRGRFRAATAWSRVGKESEDASKVEPDNVCKSEVTSRSRNKSRHSLRSIA